MSEASVPQCCAPMVRVPIYKLGYLWWRCPICKSSRGVKVEG